MLNFDKENKITFEQLSFSLQDKLRKMVTRSDIDKVESLLDMYEFSLSGVRISFVNNLSDVIKPINDCEVAVLNSSGALVLYVYTNNTWIKIPKDDVFYLMKIIQTAHQTITVANDGNNYTSNANIRYSSKWTAKVTPDLYYKAGILVSSSGIVTEPFTVSASTAELEKDFVLDCVIGKLPTNDDYGIALNWNKSTELEKFYGSMVPHMFDTLVIRQRVSGSTTTYSSSINFYDAVPVPSVYKKITMTMEYNGTSYVIFNKYNLSNFNATGDLSNYAPFTTKFFYDLFKSLKGKSVKFYVHFDD